ncbi:MAG: hypothetical protein V3U43_08210, partial [Pseudomonadales bacterium]
MNLLPLPRTYSIRSGEMSLQGIPVIDVDGPASQRMRRAIARFRRRLRSLTGYHATASPLFRVRYRHLGEAFPALGDDESY